MGVYKELVVSVALLGLVGCLAVPRPRPRPRDGDGPPNIILIVADDMGWNDVSFHGSDQIPTPNIDALAYNGVILNSHYVSAMCTPSRSALLTGKYPIHTGMQHLVILEAEPRGLPLHEKLLPQYLKEAGYSTAAIGKWHQGFFRREYTPTYRGFDSHFGYWNGLQDYYTHEVASSSKSEGFLGLDMRRNMSVARDTVGKYSTDLFTEEAVRLVEEHRALRPEAPLFLYMAHLAPHSGNDAAPLQAPDRDVARFSHVRDPERRVYAAMVSKLDESVGELVAALRRNDMLHNSVIVFMADNGAPTHGIHYNRGSNFPLRGIKGSAWEGAVRGAAAVWSPLIGRPKRVSNELMHIADWFPTLLSVAGLRPPRDIDGVDMWPAISGAAEPAQGPPRSELLVNIDPVFNYSAIRRGEFKYVLGTVGNGEQWYGETGRPEHHHLEGPSPTYDPDLVLMSQAGTAISGLLTANQVTEVRAVRNTAYERVSEEEISTATLLTADEILKLRSTATLHCTVPLSERVACDPLRAPCLFNILEDPCEERNLAASRPHVLATLEEALLKHQVTAVPPSNVPSDPNANPALWNGTWVNWLDDQPREFLFEPRELEGDDVAVSSDPIEPAPSLPGPVLALTALLLGLALVTICALIALRCNARYNRLNRKHNHTNYHNPKHFQEIQEHSEAKAAREQIFQDENHTCNKIADKELPVINNHSKSIE